MQDSKKQKQHAFFWFTIVVFSVAFCLTSVSRAEAATLIYRSVGVGDTAPLASGGGILALDVTGSTATFNTSVADKVGVGDILVYDADIDESLDSVAFIHEVVDYINRDEFTIKTAAGGEPTPTTVGSDTGDWYIYRAYISLENAESGAENVGIPIGQRNFDTWVGGKNLVSADQQWNIACYANGTQADTTTGIYINGWTTDNDNFIRIFTPQYGNEDGIDQRHSGVWDDTKYHLVSDNDFADYDAIRANGVNVEIDGLQVHQNETLGSGVNGIEILNVNGTSWIHDNIIRAGSNASAAGIALLSLEGSLTTSTYKVWNNIVYDFNDYQIFMNDQNSGMSYVYNNTVYGKTSANGITSSDGTLVAINNLAQDCGMCFLGLDETNSDYNLCEDPIEALGHATGVHSINGTELVFVDKSNHDFHLDSTQDTEAIGAAFDLTGDSHITFSDDIDDNGRTGSWDIGADEIPDLTAPTVLSVSSDKANGTYALGEVIDIDVTFSESVYSNGNVTVTLETGTVDRTCSFQVAFTTTGTCNYTVQSGDSSADLTVKTITGDIQDQAGNPMTNFTPVTNLAANKNLVIDHAYVADTSSYVPNIVIDGVSSSLAARVFYQRSGTLSFSGKQTAIAGGKVKVYRRSKLLKTYNVDAGGNWSGTAAGLKNKIYDYRFAYLNAAGSVVYNTPYYKIYVDTKKPKINNRDSLSTSAGKSIRIKTQDKTPITEYTFGFAGQTTTSTTPYFTVPASTAAGTHQLTVRVKDSAGNYSATKRIRLRVR